jgi:hypothetical protein
LTKGLEKDPEYLGMIRRGEHVTVLYKQTNKNMTGNEYLGRLVLGYDEDNEIKIFGSAVTSDDKTSLIPCI